MPEPDRSTLLAHPESKHYVTITLDGDYPASGRVECDGVENAFCRLSCPHGCESWTNDQRHPCGPEDAPHSLTPNGYCNVVESIEGSGVMDCHMGQREDVPGPRALIEVEWDEGYLWSFAEPPAFATFAHARTSEVAGGDHA